jgi:hypothetical protein
MADAASQLDLRIGAVLGSVAGRAVQAALREAADTIARMPAHYIMPAHYMKYPTGGPILPVSRGQIELVGAGPTSMPPIFGRSAR